MAVPIHQLIAAVAPDLYCEPSLRKRVHTAVHEGLRACDPDTISKAARIAKPIEPHAATVDMEKTNDPFSLELLKAPLHRRVFVRDAIGESLEALYFQLLNLVAEEDRWEVSKLVDSFEPAPGAPSHVEFAKRLSRARKEARELMESSRALVETILEDFEKLNRDQDRFRYYEDLQSDDLNRHAIALVHLKQHWLETVEQKQGSMSLLQLNSRFPNRQILDRFLNVSPVDQSTQPPDWVERTLSQREEEFSRWLVSSGARLQKILELQRSQLRYLLNQLRANARWLSPYLHDIGIGPSLDSPSLIKGFNTTHLRLVLLLDGSTLLEQRIETGELPSFLGHPKLRTYHPVVVVELDFRATGGAGKALRGRVEVRLTGYGLSTGELQALRSAAQRAELHEAIANVETSATDTVDRVVALVEPDLDPRVLNATQPARLPNPFSALISFSRSVWSRLLGRGAIPLQRRDSHLEKVKRTVAIMDAAEKCEMLFNGLKRLSLHEPAAH